MIPEGIKTEEKDKSVSSQYTEQHLDIGIKSLQELQNSGISVKHLKF